MIKFLSSWAEQIILAVMIATIIELILPNSKNKKYIQMVIGVYVLFNIISPIINDKKKLSFEQYDIEKYIESSSSEIDQTSMNERLEKIYLDELKQDITKKFNDEGFSIIQCKIEAELDSTKKNAGIHEIYIKLKETDDKEKVEQVKKEILDEYEITDEKIKISFK